MVLLAAALWGWMGRPTPPGPSRYQVVLRPAPMPPGLVGRHLALSPDGRTVVFVDTTDGIKLWIKTEDQAEAVPLTGTPMGLSPRFSPDGEWVAFVAEGKLKKVPRLGGSAVTLGDSASTTIAWLEDGTLLYRGTAGERHHTPRRDVRRCPGARVARLALPGRDSSRTWPAFPAGNPRSQPSVEERVRSPVWW